MFWSSKQVTKPSMEKQWPVYSFAPRGEMRPRAWGWSLGASLRLGVNSHRPTAYVGANRTR
jgi:hypothetical protein